METAILIALVSLVPLALFFRWMGWLDKCIQPNFVCTICKHQSNCPRWEK